jgi:hypothetical protein
LKSSIEVKHCPPAMKQTTFMSLAFERKKKRTRRERFLLEPVQNLSYHRH